MSDCCNHPGVGNQAKGLDAPQYDAYNPSEVRLYGRPAASLSIFTPEEIGNIDVTLEEELRGREISSEDKKLISGIIRRVAQKKLIDLFQQQIVLALVDESQAEVLKLL